MTDMPPEHVRSDPPGEFHGITREAVLKAIELCCMVLRPDESLIVRVPAWLDSNQIRDYQRSIDIVMRSHHLPHHVIVLPGEEFARVRQPATRPGVHRTAAQQFVDNNGRGGTNVDGDRQGVRPDAPEGLHYVDPERGESNPPRQGGTGPNPVQ